jgi:hypothetical protein
LSQCNLGYHELFLSHNAIQDTTKPFYELCLSHNGIQAITEPVHKLFFSHDGIQAITKPFHKLCFFSRWNSGYHKAFFTNFFFLTMEFLKTHDLGESSFHIYHKEYLHRIRSLKTMPLDLGPPLQGKEYGPSYSNLNARSKCFCFQNHL